MMNKEALVLNLPLHLIKTDPDQPRKHFDAQALQELADSIKEYGLLEPIGVRDNGDGTYMLIHGERRLRAHKLAALQTIKAIICPNDTDVKNTRITENTAREDLSDLDLAREFQKRVNNGETHEQIAHAIKKSRSFVTQKLSLLKLSEGRQNQLEQGKLTFTDARIIVATKNPESEKKCSGYGVTTENLEVYKLFKNVFPPGMETTELSKGNAGPILDRLYEAYRKDLATLRKALA